jgi:hypothetical protein
MFQKQEESIQALTSKMLEMEIDRKNESEETKNFLSSIMIMAERIKLDQNPARVDDLCNTIVEWRSKGRGEMPKNQLDIKVMLLKNVNNHD